MQLADSGAIATPFTPNLGQRLHVVRVEYFSITSNETEQRRVAALTESASR